MPSADGATGGAPAGDAADTESFRRLPETPDVEFEKKRAKRLLRGARAGDSDARATMARVAGGQPPAEYKLALAQLAVAREYGFSSWTKLVQYYQRWASLQHAQKHTELSRQTNIKQLQAVSGWIRNGQAQGLELYAQSIATWLPRLYGKTNVEVFASPITEDEARFIAARQSGFSTWAEVEAHAKPDPYEGMSAEERQARWKSVQREQNASPAGLMHEAIKASDIARVEELLRLHPDLLTSPGEGMANPRTYVGQAQRTAVNDPSPAADAILALLGWRPSEHRSHLNAMLKTGVRSAAGVEWLISHGADANMVWANGYSTLEHALFFYNAGQSSPEIVDQLRKHVRVVRNAFWVAAALGDVKATQSYFDRSGRLKTSARRDRLDLAILGPGGAPYNPDADDETIIFDAANMAVLNGRVAVLAALLDLGFPVDAAPYNATLLHQAVGCGSLASCEFLLSRGANPDAKQLWNKSPRWLAKEIATVDMRGERERVRIHQLIDAVPPGPEVEARPADRSMPARRDRA